MKEENMNTNRYFETIKCQDYEVFNLAYHIQRIANTICLNINLEEYIYPPNANLLKCKVIYDKSGILSIEYQPYTKKKIYSFQLVYSDISYKYKSTNRTLLENLSLQKKDCDEIIIVKDNLIADTSIANIAILYEDEWLCTKQPLLYGTTLQRYINNGTIKPTNITVPMLKNSTKIALLNAMIDFDILTNYKIKD
jgi:4-amino-4-deoxychorismate lyase